MASAKTSLGMKVVTAFIVLLGHVHATHFRGGTISWKPSDSFSLSYREVIFTFKLGWRLSRIECDDEIISEGSLVGEDAKWFCMFGCEGVLASTREKCTEFNTGEDWMLGSNTFKRVFKSDGPIEISYSECCWLTDLVVGAGGEWSLTTTLNLGIRSDTGSPNTSPVTSMAPLITLRAGVPDVIDLAVRDADGDKVQCRLGRHVGECGSICSLFPEFTLDQDNCLIRYNPVSNTTGKIPVAVMVEDFHTANAGITLGKKEFSVTEPLSSVPVQFLVVLEDPPLFCSDKPQIDFSIPPSVPVKVRPGRKFEFTVTSTPCDLTSSIEDFILIAPLGVRRSPIIEADGAYTTKITWTPEPDQDGSNAVCVTARSSNGVLSEKKCVTVDVPKATATCSVIGGSQFITFDQTRYDHFGSCEYVLVETVESPLSGLTPFRVSLSNEVIHGGENRIGTMTVKVMDQVVVIDNRRNVRLNGVAVNTPVRLKSGLRVEKGGTGLSISLSFALRIHIDRNTLTVQLPRNYMGHVEGLCGNYNGLDADDFTIKGGSFIPSDVTEFTSSFQVNQACLDTPQNKKKAVTTCGATTEDLKKCNIIKESNGCFSECHEFIDPTNYYENCISAVCKTDDSFTTLDVRVRAYADACQREAIPVCNWRQQIGIALECEPYSHYESCTRMISPTCADTEANTNPHPSDSCMEGCVCDKGYILSGSSCVPESECGCIIDGNYYPKGFAYRTEDCARECECGEECKPAEPCSKQATCQKGTDGLYRCVEELRAMATCKALTDPHYETFDGTKFDAMGSCAYTMVRSKRSSPLTSFTVVAVNEQPNKTVNVSHVKEVHVHFGDDHTLSLLQGQKVILNDKEINPGSSVHGVTISKVGLFIAADFNFGLVVKWDGIDRLRIDAWSPLRHMVEGLCGDFDDDPKNDFTVRPTEEIVPDAGSFAQSWRVKGYGTDGCRDYPGVKVPKPSCNEDSTLAKYQQECRGLTDPKGVFAPCHDFVSPWKSFSDCVYDLCAYDGDLNLKERVFASYADDCLEITGTPRSWRDEEELPKDCGEGIYSECMEPCQPTCSDPDGTICQSKSPQQLGATCVEGCVCPPGLLLSGSECVEPEDCGCLVNGRYEKKGFKFAIANCSDVCECKGPEDLECSPVPFGCKKNRDSCVRREDGYFECVQRLRRRATCKAVTDPHYMTFDGKNYDSMGTCAYIMVRSKTTYPHAPFRVVAVNEEPVPGLNVSHVKEAWIHVGEDFTLSFTEGAVVKINGIVVEPGTNTSLVEVRKVGRFTVADFSFGLVVRWDGKDRLRVSAWGRLRGQMEGLCGDFDDDVTNDFTTPDGELVENITDFVNSWKIDGYDSEGCRDPQQDDPNNCGPDITLNEAREICSEIMKENGTFSECHESVDWVPYFEDCVFDTCTYNGDEEYKERLFSEYVQECREANVSVPDDWRDKPALQINCTANSHAENCMKQCQPTCTDRTGEKCEEASTLGEECVIGCVCDEGYILSGGQCVRESECGCIKEDGSYLLQGFKWRTNNCSMECECVPGGDIVCSDVGKCEPGYRCRHSGTGYKSCIPHVRRRATCKAVTDPHYQTFDGVNFDSMGTCAYIMARSRKDSGVTPFTVVAVNEQSLPHQNVSHVKEVVVHVGENITLVFRAGPVVLMNEEVLVPGSKVHDIEIRRVGRFLVAEFPFGLVIRWDGVDRLRVMAWAELKEKVEGLCGDFNDNPENDFTAPNGTLHTGLVDFVNSWRVDGYDSEGCRDPTDNVSPCDEDPALLEEHRESCRVLIDPHGPLLSCKEVKDPDSAFNNCVFDQCAYNGDEAMRQRVISSYVEDCKEDSFDDPGELIWIPSENMTVTCTDNAHFVGCMDQCQPTCNDPDTSKCKASSKLGTNCVEGCKCDDGYILSGDSCVALEECGCEIDGRYIAKGANYTNNNCTVECTCLGEDITACSDTGGCAKGFRCRYNGEGRKACIPHVRRRATCSAVTDPHYTTFDKKKFDSMGTCAYMMVRNKESSDLPQFKVIAVNERPQEDQIVSHVKEVHVEIGKNFHMSFTAGAVVKINGEITLPGSTVDGVAVRKVGRFTIAELPFGLVIKWDGIDRLRISAWGNLKGKVEGICGDFDDDPSNDFTTPRGIIEENINKFVRSWKVHLYSPQGCIESPNINETGCPNEEVLKQYEKECSELTDREGSFAKCHATVDPTPFYENCLFDMCWTNGDQELKLRNIHEYTETCLEDDPLNTPENITEFCPQNMISKVPMAQCQPTCSDPDASICEATTILGSNGIAGCECIEGMILSGNECIPKSECGCLIDGKYREKGFKFLNYECNLLCECVGLNDIKCDAQEPCTIDERCSRNSEQQYECLPFTKRKATCKAHTDPHFTTYDGQTFDSLGTCAYIMTRSRFDSDAPTFRVVVLNEPSDNNRTSSSVSEVHVEIGDDFRMLMRRDMNVRINDVVYNHGSTVSGAHIRKIGMFTVVDFPFGLVVRWDGKDRLRVTAWDQLKNKLEGICGNFNEDSSDDLMKSDGTHTNDTNAFVDSWKVDGYNAWKCKSDQEMYDNDCADIGVLAGYEEECGVLLDSKGPFADCHKVIDPNPAYEACVSDLCRMDGDRDYKNQVFSSFVHDCLELSEYPKPWRVENDLPMTCGENSRYMRCMPQCQPTCGDLDAMICKKTNPFLLGGNCVEGCKCMSGYYLSDRKCVPLDKCGCLVDGRYFTKGFKYKTKDCTQECVCKGNNTFECKDFSGCLDNQICKVAFGGYYQCVQAQRKRATCKAITDPHYTTFDQKIFDAQGVCSYIMVRSKSTAVVEPFTLVTVNEQPRPGTKVSHVKEVHLEFKGNYKLSFYAGPTAQLNGETVLPGTTQFGMKIVKVGRFLTAILDFGITIKWDGEDRLRIIAWGSLRGQIEGMCGDFNDDPSDDFVHGTTGEILTDIDEFVNSWRIMGYNDQCNDVASDVLTAIPSFTCDKTSEVLYQQKCNFIIDPNGPMKQCHHLIDAEAVYGDCVMDMCAYGGDENIKERVVSDFAEVCREDGGKLEVDWREKADLVDVPCPANSHFVSCMSQCQRTCDDVDGSECRDKLDLGDSCVEGCEADDGYVLSGDSFVPKAECGCKKDGRYHMHKESFYTEGCATLCQCVAGAVTCNAAQCTRGQECIINAVGKLDCVPIETATCQIWGSTHFSSYDGKEFDLRTPCYYTVSKRETERGFQRESFFITTGIIKSKDIEGVTIVRHVRVRLPSHSSSILLRNAALARVNGKSVRNMKMVQEDGDWVTINPRGTYIVLKTNFGLEVAYDGHHLIVTVPNRYSGKIDGLCGDYNGNPDDDLKLKNGSVTKHPVAFAKHNVALSCKIGKLTTTPVCSPEDKKRWSAPDKCGALTDKTSEFALCATKLNAVKFMEDCVKDMCLSNGSDASLTQAFKAYAHQCMGIDIPVCNWRRNYMLQVACPVNSHYEGCTEACEATCGVLPEKDCKFQQVENCVCDKGYIRFNGDCIPSANCAGCLLNKQMVPKDFTYRRNDCGKQCTCVGDDQVVCESADPCITRANCGNDKDGFQQCLLEPRTRAICQVFGSTHFETFDGAQFSSPVTCPLTMVQTIADATVPRFTVKVRLQSRSDKPSVSHVAEIIVTAKDLDFIMGAGRLVLVNGRRVALGSDLEMVNVRRIGRDVVAFFKFGLTLRWDGKENLRIEAWKNLQNQVEGLCGDYDENEKNDFKTSSNVIETDTDAFVNSWRDTSSDNSCQVSTPIRLSCSDKQELARYQSACDDMYDRGISAFHTCNLNQHCVHEMCATGGDREAVLINVNMFADNCMANTPEGDVTGPLPESPAIVCSNNSNYSPCMAQCQPTCSDPDSSVCQKIESLPEKCVEGCKCEEGYVLDRNECVKKSECGCLGHTGEYYQNRFDSYLEDCESHCKCNDGVLTCTQTNCEKGQYCGHRNKKYGCHWEDECMYENGGCEHYCMWENNEVICSCRPGYNLGSDNRTCTRKEEAPCKTDSISDLDIPKWKQEAMQSWIDKLDAYLKATKREAYTGESAYACIPNWTEWFDRDDPDFEGDDESLEKLKEENPGKICDRPVSIEVRLRDGRNAMANGNIISTFGAETGLQCLNSEQRTGEICGDFQVRFLCLQELI